VWRAALLFLFLLGDGAEGTAANTAAASVAWLRCEFGQVAVQGPDFLRLAFSGQLVGKTAVVAAVAQGTVEPALAVHAQTIRVEKLRYSDVSSFIHGGKQK
jgi:hypothetical protein